MTIQIWILRTGLHPSDFMMSSQGPAGFLILRTGLHPEIEKSLSLLDQDLETFSPESESRSEVRSLCGWRSV
jgi:hypothetical protein